jgi:alpha-galactosidase
VNTVSIDSSSSDVEHRVVTVNRFPIGRGFFKRRGHGQERSPQVHRDYPCRLSTLDSRLATGCRASFKSYWLALSATILGAALAASGQTTGTLRNSALTVAVRPQDGSYEISARDLKQPVLISRVGAEIDGHWLRSTDYPHHQIAESTSEDALGQAHLSIVTFSGLPDKPDLVCVLRLYDAEPYGDVSVEVHNTTQSKIAVHAIRDVDAVGNPRIALGADQREDRILAETASEDPPVHIGGLDEAPHGVYFGQRSDLIYNLTSQDSLLLAALTSSRFMTLSHLRVVGDASGSAGIGSFSVDSTGTTEWVLSRDDIPADQQVQLSLSVAAGGSLASERVMFAAGKNYYAQLEAYGAAVRRLHHARVSTEAPMGWWSWTAFYGGINEGEVLTNADWLATHLKQIGYNYFHIDEGYDYARGEYVTANATQFPHGMRSIGYRIVNDGLTFAIWTAPFEVSQRAWVYEHHKDWLVHDAQGQPIFIGHVDRRGDRLYALDTTNPGAQDYLRHTYRVLTREWGVRYIKLDFMDSSAVEGYFYRPNTTALEAQRLGLEIIRETVGNDVLLDKDGSAMLNPVGLVNEGRISVDTGHSFESSKDAAPNIAARFFMNRNFYISDPDAFSVSKQMEPQQTWHEARKGLTLNEAEVQIVLAAVSGGMYEIGDDLPTLGSEPRRLALVKNHELIEMVRLGRAALPLDLMTFRPEDEQPSIFFLREDARQAMLAVFNWTEQPRSHTFTLAGLRLPPDHPFQAFDVLNHDAPVDLQGGRLTLENQPPRSVRLIKLVDSSVPAAGPSVSAHVPSQALAGDSVAFSAEAGKGGTPAISYRWDFGDGTGATGRDVVHTYTMAGTFTVRLTADGVSGRDTQQTFPLAITGYPRTAFNLKANRRYKGSEQ